MAKKGNGPVAPSTDGAPTVEPRVFQIAEADVITLFRALGALPYSQADPIIKFLQGTLKQVASETKVPAKEVVMEAK